MKTSRFALAAAAGLFVGAMAFTPAQAADLGGDCCADLEERVAELEATTARKGNRVVSLEVSGRVNRALLIWDDGEDSDVYVVDNDQSSSRLGFAGSAALKPGWEAGYDVTFNVQEADSSEVSQLDHDANDSGKDVAFDIRRAYVYVESAQFGRLTLGQGEAATDGTSEVDLGFGNYGNDPLYNTSFNVIGADTGTSIGLTFGDLGFNLDGAGRTNNIRYDSPTLAGFIVSASFGENDYYDVALRFSKEWNSIRFAAAVGYAEFSEPDRLGDDQGPDSEIFSSSASIMHTPSGFFVSGAYAVRDIDDDTQDLEGCADDFEAFDDNCIDTGVATAGLGTVTSNGIALEDADEDSLGDLTAVRDRNEDEFFSVKAGFMKDWTGYGATTIFGFYSHFQDFAVGNILETEFTEDGNDTLVDYFQVTDTQKDMYAFGINQNFASAATDIYMHFEYTETEVEGVELGESGVNAVCDAGETSCEIETEDFWAVVVGSRIRF